MTIERSRNKVLFDLRVLRAEKNELEGRLFNARMAGDEFQEKMIKYAIVKVNKKIKHRWEIWKEIIENEKEAM